MGLAIQPAFRAALPGVTAVGRGVHPARQPAFSQRALDRCVEAQGAGLVPAAEARHGGLRQSALAGLVVRRQVAAAKDAVAGGNEVIGRPLPVTVPIVVRRNGDCPLRRAGTVPGFVRRKWDCPLPPGSIDHHAQRLAAKALAGAPSGPVVAAGEDRLARAQQQAAGASRRGAQQCNALPPGGLPAQQGPPGPAPIVAHAQLVVLAADGVYAAGDRRMIRRPALRVAVQHSAVDHLPVAAAVAGAVGGADVAVDQHLLRIQRRDGQGEHAAQAAQPHRLPHLGGRRGGNVHGGQQHQRYGNNYLTHVRLSL